MTEPMVGVELTEVEVSLVSGGGEGGSTELVQQGSQSDYKNIRTW